MFTSGRQLIESAGIFLACTENDSFAFSALVCSMFESSFLVSTESSEREGERRIELDENMKHSATNDNSTRFE